MELPLFEDCNPDDWLFRVEKCLVMNTTPEFKTLDQAMASLTGPTVTGGDIHKDVRQ